MKYRMKSPFFSINYLYLFLAGCSLLVPARLPAQDGGENTTIAVVPFKGSPPNIVADFGDVLQQALPKAGPYTQYLVDMDNLPPDVPEGGFPPYVCPSPSMTNNAPYALTGEVTPDADDPSSYHLRMYLWEMANNRLVFSDELSAPDKEACEQSLPSLLNWILSWIKSGDAPAQAAAPAKPEPEQWLHLGLRAGSSLRLYSRETAAPFMDSQVMHFYNLNVAFHAALHLLPWFDVQAEVNWTTDYAPYSADKGGHLETVAFNSMSLMLPLLARFSARKGLFSASLLAGVYGIVPLGKMSNTALGGDFDYHASVPLGYTAGVNMGVKLGPGRLFLDIRWAADLGPMVKSGGDEIYRRSMVMFNIGYEWGMITKKPPSEKKPPQEKKPPEDLPLEDQPPEIPETGA